MLIDGTIFGEPVYPPTTFPIGLQLWTVKDFTYHFEKESQLTGITAGTLCVIIDSMGDNLYVSTAAQGVITLSRSFVKNYFGVTLGGINEQIQQLLKVQVQLQLQALDIGDSNGKA